jgi:acyl dehydratase
LEIEMTKTEDLYYEDVEVGAEIETATHTVRMQDVLTFADVTRDHHPLHVDDAYCSKTQYGRPIAHGLYGLSLIEGLKSELKLYENTSIGSLGWDKVRFKAPIFPGDSVRVKMRFLSKRESQKPDRGVVIEEIALVNQRGEVVTEAEHATLLYRKSKGG